MKVSPKTANILLFLAHWALMTAVIQFALVEISPGPGRQLDRPAEDSSSWLLKEIHNLALSKGIGLSV